jgi:AraC-like DNA-binding protein
MFETVNLPGPDIVERARARGSLFARSSLSAPWAFQFPPEPSMQFHIVLAGQAWVRTGETGAACIRAGEVGLVVAVREYELASDPTTEAQSFEPLRTAAREARSLSWPGHGTVTELICGAYDLDGILAPAARAELPPVLCVPWRSDIALNATVSLLIAELRRTVDRSQLVVDRFVDALFAQIIRVGRRGMSARVPHDTCDSSVVEALGLMHRMPEQPWTLDLLAGAVCLSRAAFARRFSAAVGEPAMRYLARVRMARAAELLAETSEPISVIASKAGYANGFAFSSAFKRATGTAPSTFRREARLDSVRRAS